MAIERYPFLVDIAFVLVGVYFATMHLFYIPQQQDMAGKTQKTSTGSVVNPSLMPMEQIPPERAPKNSVILTAAKSGEKFSYIMDGAVIESEAVLLEKLQSIAKDDPGRVLLLKVSSMETYGDLQDVGALVKKAADKAGLASYMLAEKGGR